MTATCDHDALVWQTYDWPNAESKSEVFSGGHNIGLCCLRGA
ncbi:hypothetical protein [Roseateles flavus]|uniref:Uncharacterized protein n=1 Tax=Roseateles flavus TaxID=3149041 RepID=A0ABV0G8C0_9BURK